MQERTLWPAVGKKSLQQAIKFIHFLRTSFDSPLIAFGKL
jgi:hypothetical protein